MRLCVFGFFRECKNCDNDAYNSKYRRYHIKYRIIYLALYNGMGKCENGRKYDPKHPDKHQNYARYHAKLICYFVHIEGENSCAHHTSAVENNADDILCALDTEIQKLATQIVAYKRDG